jgi:methylmalonyl-CoA mutase N-terminal domain/subunit
MNRFHTDEHNEGELLRVNESVRVAQMAALAQLRRERDNAAVQAILVRIDAAARDPQASLMPLFVEAVAAYATLGEICDTLRGVFGEYTPESWV